jgi:hypothetical protein
MVAPAEGLSRALTGLSPMEATRGTAVPGHNHSDIDEGQKLGQ